MSKDNKKFKEAIDLFNSKQYEKSETLLQNLSSLQPKNFDVLHALGVVLGVQNKHKESIKYFELSLQIKPLSATANFNLANAYFTLEDYIKAELYFQKSNNLLPNNISILLKYGKCLIKLNKYEKAVKIFQKILNLDKTNYEAWFNLGIVFKYEKNYEDSIIAFDNAINLNNKNSIIFNQKGTVLYELEKYNEALECFNYALNLNHKDLPEIYSNIVITILSQYRNNLECDIDLALKYSKKIIDIDPNNILANSNLGLCYLYKYDLNNAFNFLKKAQEAEPYSVESNYNLGLAYKFNKELETSEIYLQKAVDNDTKSSLRLTLAEVQLAQNKFIDGWENYEFRDLKTQKISSLNFSKPYWEPSMGYGNICIWREQGLGDAMLFSTIIRDILDKFQNIHLLVDKRLIKLFKENFPELNVYDYFSDKIDESLFDYHISLSSLGKYFRSSINDFSNAFPLNVEMKDLYKDKKKLRCGISWRSYSPSGKHKSINLESLKNLIQRNDIDFYDIQYTDEDREVLDFESKYGIKIKKPENVDTYNDIYGLMQFIKSCDFVVSISNTNAHLAGALGVPTYLLLSKGAGALWYWFNEKDGSNLWYPSIKKFQQTNYMNWDSPINDLIKIVNQTFEFNDNFN